MSTPRTLTAIFTIWVAIASAPSRAHACMCAPSTVLSAYDGSAAVFEGFVKEVGEPQTDPSGAGRRRTVRLQVVSAWKGAEGEEVTLSTAADSAMCGYTFQVERSYLVYATSSAGGLEVSLCSRTKPMGEAGEDLAQLGMGATPVDPKANPSPEPEGTRAEPPARGGCAGCAIAGRSSGSSAAFACTATVMAALSLRRRRHASRSRSQG